MQPIVRPGMRVRLTKSPHDGKAGIWEAGEVPIGTLGTLYIDEEEFPERLMYVKWDDIKEQNGYRFGVCRIHHPLPDEFEAID